MYNFILTITTIVSAGVMIYIIARALPRLEVQHPEDVPEPRDVFDRMLGHFPLEKIDRRIAAFIERVLRKMRLALLRVDNSINERIVRIRKSTEQKDVKQMDVEKLNEKNKK